MIRSRNLLWRLGGIAMKVMTVFADLRVAIISASNHSLLNPRLTKKTRWRLATKQLGQKRKCRCSQMPIVQATNLVGMAKFVLKTNA